MHIARLMEPMPKSTLKLDKFRTSCLESTFGEMYINISRLSHKSVLRSRSSCSFGMRPAKCNRTMAASAMSDRSRCQAALFSAASPIIRAHRVGSYEFHSACCLQWIGQSSHLILHHPFYRTRATCLVRHILRLRLGQGHNAFSEISLCVIAFRR